MKTQLWNISRGFVGPFGRIQYRPLFTVEAPNEDRAIWIGAHKVRGLALLKATPVPDTSERSFFSLQTSDENPGD